jgi:ABC-type antimicrobial peptide transport system permease subunit
MSQELAEERVTALLSAFFAAPAKSAFASPSAPRVKMFLWLVLRETLALTLFGIAIGIPSAIAATHLIAKMLFGLSPSSLPTITIVSLLLLLVALFAGYLPARRASAIDPVVALRAE